MSLPSNPLETVGYGGNFKDNCVTRRHFRWNGVGLKPVLSWASRWETSDYLAGPMATNWHPPRPRA